MPTIQLTLDPETSARLAFLAELEGKGKGDEAIDLLKVAVFQKYNERANRIRLPDMLDQSRRARPGARGQPVLYVGTDSRLQKGKIYRSYAEVLRIVRPDLLGLLYDAKQRRGDKAESILKRYEPGVYNDLLRQ